MSRYLRPRAAASAVMTGLMFAPAFAQQSNPAVRPDLVGQISSLAPDAVYRSWRSRQLIGQKVAAKNGSQIGSVRDLIVDADGRLAAVVVEGGGAVGIPDAVYRIPWAIAERRPGRGGLTVDLSSGGKRPPYALFPGTESVETLPREFRVTEVLGDYARLQTGSGYGYVTDVAFNSDGRMIAVLVTRDADVGGGTYAFPYPGTTGRWDPALSYYGLPFVTEGQAREAGLRIDPKRFKS